MCSHLSAGNVLLRDGKSYTGNVEFKSGNEMVITPATGPGVMIRVDDLVRLSMAETGPAAVTLTNRDPYLPLPWQQCDIGRVKEAGNAAATNGRNFTAKWGSNRSFGARFKGRESGTRLRALRPQNGAPLENRHGDTPFPANEQRFLRFQTGWLKLPMH